MTIDLPSGPGHRTRRRSGASYVIPPAVADYVTDLVLRHRLGTAKTVQEPLIRVHRWLANKGVEALTATALDLQGYQGYLATDYRTPAGAPIARSTLATHIAILKSWYRWLAMHGRIVADPSRRLAVRHVPSRVVLREPLSLQEATALVQTQSAIVDQSPQGSFTRAVAVRNLAAICLGLATGRRVAGMTTLQVADIDLERNELRVAREKGRTGRVLPLAGWAVEVVRTYIQQARPLLAKTHDTPWLFLNRSGDAPISRDGLQWTLEELLAATIKANPDLDELPGKRISWHSLRVSFATMLFSNGCDIRSVNELMLHRSLSTTARYTPIPVDDLRQALRTAHPRP